MITIYFGNDNTLNESIRTRLEIYQIDYQEYTSADIYFSILMSLFSKMTDMFDLLNPRLISYKLDNKLTMSQFIQKVLSDRDNRLKLPIAVTEKGVFPCFTPEEVSMFRSKEFRKAEKLHLFKELEKIDNGRLFWRNFERFRMQSELRWFELNELLFTDVSNDLGEIKKAKDRFFSYKKNKEVPPDEIVEKICKIFLVDREEFFKKSISNLQNF
ncbi:hypothetical protein [Streptococcus acidominimus]|uniref:Uncharacterized protein n=1 Tax=Streptococcus acidominimus TaxID=1326 RepID=A0A1Q8EDE4_STRAI|nr:hypothetical protein [Streptococcus acidominimus]OLF49802.1 hypothetical protein BU200_05510 [Streptococcus acidominimus]SUN08608.1 Uncharacterised protein [Streptococcus acidominimus]